MPLPLNDQIDAMNTKMETLDTVSDSLLVLFATWKQMYKDALAGTVLSPETQAKLTALDTAVTKQAQEIADAIVAGTPDAPTP